MASSIVGDIIRNPAVQEHLLKALVKWFTGLFNRSSPPPVVTVVVPTPKPVQDDSTFPDDVIPTPTPKRSVVTARIKLARIQLSRERFPGNYTDDNPMGLMEDKTGAIPWASKIWTDITGYDAQGREFLRDAVLSHGLAFKTEHHIGDAFIKGHGAGQDGSPMPGYETNDTDEMGNGISAWNSSLGFLHQWKAHGEGTFEVYGVLNGVETNHLQIKVS